MSGPYYQTAEAAIVINGHDVELDVVYSYHPEELPTRDCPGWPEEFEIVSIYKQLSKTRLALTELILVCPELVDDIKGQILKQKED